MTLDEILQRPPAIPVYKAIETFHQVEEDDIEGWAGRIWYIGAQDPETYAAGGYDQQLSILKQLAQPEDVVWFPFYVGFLGSPPAFPPPMHPDFDKFVAAVEELGPRVHSILIGNQGPELSWSHTPHNTYYTQSFIHATATRALRAGANRLAYGLIDHDVIFDAFAASFKIKQTMIRYGAFPIVFSGFTLCPGAFYPKTHPDFWEQQALIREWEGKGKITGDILEKSHTR